jgi:hypothetical protein
MRSAERWIARRAVGRIEAKRNPPYAFSDGKHIRRNTPPAISTYTGYALRRSSKTRLPSARQEHE